MSGSSCDIGSRHSTLNIRWVIFFIKCKMGDIYKMGDIIKMGDICKIGDVYKMGDILEKGDTYKV